jgi:hypothetical protein
MPLAAQYSMILAGPAARTTFQFSSVQAFGLSDKSTLVRVSISLEIKVCRSWLCTCKVWFWWISGYPVTEWTVRPFTKTELDDRQARHLRQNRVKWNTKHSRAHIGAEHYFGGLKGWFPALKLVPGRDIKQIYLSVEALIIVHNILMELNNAPEEIDGFTPQEGDEGEDPLANPFWLRRENDTEDVRRDKRLALRDHLVSYMVLDHMF